ncbi:MAG: hypothetical protein WA760_00205, partial [Pseudolabrys sp.]
DREFLAFPDHDGELSPCNLSPAVSRRAGRHIPAGWASAAGTGEAASALSERSQSRPRGVWRRAKV